MMRFENEGRLFSRPFVILVGFLEKYYRVAA